MNTRLESRPSARARTEVLPLVLSGLLLAAGIAVMVPALRLPSHVDRVTINNPYMWQVNVDVTGSDYNGRLDLGVARPNSELSFREVLDQGETWVFEFAYSGEQVEVTISRSDLEADGWQVSVPPELAAQLSSAGVPRTP